jgi:hypothetical protein
VKRQESPHLQVGEYVKSVDVHDLALNFTKVHNPAALMAALQDFFESLGLTVAN